MRLDPIATYVSISVGAPLADISVAVESNDVRASLDEFGFSDIYVEPLRLGWRLPQVDLVAGPRPVHPDRPLRPGGLGSVGSGQWSRELLLGTTLYFDTGRTWRISALSSYISNLSKRGIDIRRGSVVQIQGGLGAALDEAIVVGIAGYALWQVSDDTGDDLPAVLRGARDRAFGAGPEIDFTLSAIRSMVTLRYEHDIAAASRPLGQLFTVGYTFSAWSP